MEIDALGRKMGGLPKHVIEQAKEYRRLCEIKMAKSNKPALYSICQSAACLELACRHFDETFDRKLLYNLSGGTAKIYQTCLRMIQNLVLKPVENEKDLTIRMLCVKFGCTQLYDNATNLFENYKNNFFFQLPLAAQKNVNLTRAIFKAACIAVVAKKSKVNLELSELLATLNINRNEFKSICVSMEKTCQSSINQLSPTSEKRKREDKDVDIDLMPKCKMNKVNQENLSSRIAKGASARQVSLQRIQELIAKQTEETNTENQPILILNEKENKLTIANDMKEKEIPTNEQYQAWKLKALAKARERLKK